MGQVKEYKKNDVKKHVAVIHSANNMSLLQRKISNALLYHAYPDLPHKEEHEITVKQLCNIIGYQGHNHQAIKDALKELISIVIEWNIIDDVSGEEDWTASSLIACARIKGSICTYAYSPRMRNLLFLPSMYGKINIAIQARFKSNYGLALYENCIRFKGLPYTRWFDLEKFRKLMGVSENTYSVFRDFKKRIIDKSIEEVNTYSDIIVEPEFLKERRAVVSIRFKIKEREKKKKFGTMVNEDVSTKSSELIDILATKFCLSISQINDLFSEYSEEKIMEKIKLIESSATYLSGKIHNLTAFLLSALKDDYRAAKSSAKAIHEDRAVEEINEAESKIKLRQEELQRKAYTQYVNDHIEHEISLLEAKQLKNIKDDFLQHLLKEQNTYIQKLYDKNELNNSIVKIFFNKFIQDNFQCVVKDMLNFENFVNESVN